MKLSQLFLCWGGIFVAVSATAIIDPSLKQRFLLPENTQNIMISFTQSIGTVINQINLMNFSSPTEKRTALTNAQKAFSGASQGQLQNFLNSLGVNYESFWINNKIIVPNVNSGLVNLISNIPGVAKIEKQPVAKIALPFADKSQLENSRNMTRYAREASAQWGIAKKRADQVWGSYTGKGIVVANIDTGVRPTHESLSSRWRACYGWYDPHTKSTTPDDEDGHGTHTMGTIAGSNGIGVAPEATWIACRGCKNSKSCSAAALLACGQWVQCPTKTDGVSNPDCSKAPNVVSNSWEGGDESRSWYDDIIASWHAADIIPVFSIGNSGPSCSTTGSPGDRPNVISVGSTESNDRISKFSSAGPSREGQLKPEISAPGGKVQSAWHTGDNAYHSMSGTSMACPHVSGVVALMRQKNPSANFNQILNAITSTAVTNTLERTEAVRCGGRFLNFLTSYPNNVFGYGRIDAMNSVNAI